MILTKKRGLKAGLALTVTLMLMLSAMPGGSVTTPKVEAYGESSDGYYYAETYLYDYDYDSSAFVYNNDHQNAFNNPSVPVYYNWQQCHDLRNGDRWMTGLQVPYETLNRQISAFYSGKSAPALYFGNFYGTANDITDPRGNGEGQTPYQKTYKPGLAGDFDYSEAYNNYWQSANNSPKTNSGNVAVQDLVDKKLKNGTITQQNGAFELPQFSDSFINSSALMHKYSTGNGFPFNISTDSHGIKTYSFDSSVDHKRYYKNGQILVGTETNHPLGTVNWRSDQKTVTGGDYGFFPFNESNITAMVVGRTNVNYGFGMKVSIPFNLSEDGMLTGTDGTTKIDTVFNFSGDDDVWVFVDDVLVLDLGGDHAKVSGDINFNRSKQSTGRTIEVSDAYTFNSGLNRQNRASGTGRSYKSIPQMYQAAGVTFNESEFYNPATEHTLTVFYMERGMFESNLSISFNFAPVNRHQLTVGEQTLFNRVNPALLRQTRTVADKDVFNYTIKNQNTDPLDVANSGITFPTYANVNRVNTDAYGNPSTTLAVSNQKTVQKQTVTSTNYLYLQPKGSIDWTTGGARFAAYFYNSKGGTKWVNLEHIGNNIYRCEDPGGYPNVIFCRMNGSTTTNNFDNCWNQTPNLTITANNYYCVPTGWGDSDQKVGTANFGSNSTYQYTVTTTTTENVPVTFGDLFTGGTSMTPLSRIAYNLTDPFASTKVTGITNTSGQFNLFYGEYANFKSQFSKDSTMSVVQASGLKKNSGAPMDTTSVNNPDKYHHLDIVASSRTVSKYYDTFVYAVDVNDSNKRIEEYRNNQPAGINYRFNNNDTSSNKSIHIKQTFVNVVKVGDLVIGKELAVNGETDQLFTFDVALSALYGDTSGMTVDISTLEYEVFPKGTTNYYGTPYRSGRVASGIKIKGGEIAVIKQIPVDTMYTVSERNDDNYFLSYLSGYNGRITEGTYTYNPTGDITGTIIGNTATSVNRANALNVRKTGSLTVSKTITGTGADTSDTFAASIELNASEGVTLADYITEDYITMSNNTTGLSLSFPSDRRAVISFTVTNNSSVTVTNIPYGTTYNVSEESGDYTMSVSWGDNNKIIDKNGASDTAAITNTKNAPEIATIVIQKFNNYNSPLAGAEFKIYASRADAVAKNNNTVPGAVYSKNAEGTVFTFEKLTPNTTYYIAETVVPDGHIGISAPLEVTTGARGSTKTVRAENTQIEIVMPETGGTPFLIDFSVIGVLALGLAAAALVIYKRKLQSETLYTEEKGRYKGE